MFYSKEERIQIFIESVAINGETQTEAYLKAYPNKAHWKRKTINEYASRFAKDGKVQARINETVGEIKKKLKTKFDMTLNDTLCELMNIGWFNPKDLVNEDGSFKDISEIPEHTMRAITTLEFGQMNKVDESGEITGNITYISKYRQDSKIQALKQILDFQLSEHDKPPEDDEKEEIDPIQLARRVISLIYTAKQKLDKDKHGDITHSRGNQTSANDR